MFDHASAPYGKDALVREIAALGFDVPPGPGAGVSLPVPVDDVLSSNDLAEQFLTRLECLLDVGIPVCLSPSMSGEESVVIGAWQRFCELLRDFLFDRGLEGRRLAICMAAHLMPAEAWCLVADAVLGCGPRYLFLDSLLFRCHAQDWLRQRVESTWRFLWRHTGQARPVLPVYGGAVRSVCPLLSGEVALSLLPGSGLLSPRQSAWLPVELSLPRFATPAGRLDEGRLHRHLRRMLRLADQLIDLTDWPDPEQAADARQNRRIAVMLGGFGELVAQNGEDPCDFAVLNRLSGVAAGIRRVLQDESTKLVALSGPVPALSPVDLTAAWLPGSGRELWQSAWQDAFQKCAVRHRNLVVMSPASVLPPGADGRYADLLPIIAHADAWCFASPVVLAGAGPTAWRAFHHRARAVIQGATADSFVAAGT
jgi:hypothetical protein